MASEQHRAKLSPLDAFLLHLLFAKDGLVIFKQSLHRHALLLNVGEFPLNVHRTHDRGRENDRHIERCHLGTYQ